MTDEMDPERRNDPQNKGKDERSPEEIERDLEAKREQLAEDLDDLSRKVRPENLKKQAMQKFDEAKEAAMERVEKMREDVVQRTESAGERLVGGVRENPMPVALLLGALGAGYVLMQARSGGGSGGSERRFRSGYDEDGVVGDSPHVVDRTGSAFGGSSYGGSSYGYREGRSGEGRDSSFLERNGLLVGLGALAAGAAVGLLMPASREKMREATQKAGQRIGGAFSSSSSSRSSRRRGGIQVHERIRVNKSPEELYRFWRDLKNLPKVMSHLESVDETTGKRSHWKAKGPLNTSVEWDAIVTDERPNELIAWRSVEDAQVPNEGSVRFRRVSQNATDVVVSLTYHPPGGPFGQKIAQVFGEEPSQQISDDLEKFKQEVEAGRMSLMTSSLPSSSGTTTGSTTGTTTGSTGGSSGGSNSGPGI